MLQFGLSLTGPLLHLFSFTLLRCLVDVCPAEDDPEAAAEERQVESLAPPTAPEPADQVTPSSTDVEPASERRDLESPITQQPEPHLEEAPTHTAEQVTFHKHQDHI